MRPSRDIHRSIIYKNTEVKHKFFKKCAASIIKPNLWVYSNFFSKFGSFSRKKTFCVFTKKPRSVFSKFKLSRITFRELASFGVIYGVSKSSW